MHYSLSGVQATFSVELRRLIYCRVDTLKEYDWIGWYTIWLLLQIIHSSSIPHSTSIIPGTSYASLIRSLPKWHASVWFPLMLPTKEINLTELCSRCRYKKETLPHILNNCNTQLSDKITQLHDHIVTRIKKRPLMKIRIIVSPWRQNLMMIPTYDQILFSQMRKKQL